MLPPPDPEESQTIGNTPNGERVLDYVTPPDEVRDSTDPSASAEKTPHDPYVALRNPNYRRYFIGNAFSLVGGNLTTYVVAYELYKRTNSTLMLGMVGLVQVIPILLLALPAGHFIDRFNRKKMILISTAVQILLWVIMGLSSRFADSVVPQVAVIFGLRDSHAPVMLALLLTNGICRSVNQPAKQTLLPILVPAKHFPNAITWNASLFETSNVLGPMTGGLALWALLGSRPSNVNTTWAFAILYWFNALCQLINWINISRIKLDHQTPPKPVHDSMFASIREGVVFVFRRKIILSALTLDMFAVLLGGATALLPVFADHVLFVGPFGLACLRAAPSAGAVLMAITLAHMPPMKHAGRNLLLAVMGFGVAIIVFGLSRNFWLSLVALFVTGLCDNISVVVRHSLVQLLTPDYMRGRVNSVNTVFISSSNELGEFESGMTAHYAQVLLARWWGAEMAASWGPMLATVAGGAGTVAVVIVAAVLWPQLARVGKLEELRAAKTP